MAKPVEVTLAEGEEPLPELPKQKRSGKGMVKDAAMTGVGAVGSIGPVRRAAKRLYFGVLGLVGRRKRRRENEKYGD